jgi:hypothetical protein
VAYGVAWYASDFVWLGIEASHDLRLLEPDLKHMLLTKNHRRSKYDHISNDAALSFIS